MATEGFSKGYVMTMAAAGTTATVDVLEGFERCYLQISSHASATALDVYASVNGGSNYYQVRHAPNPLTATVMGASFIIAASMMSQGAIVPMPPGFRYYKIIATDSAPAAAVVFTLLANT